MVTSYESVDAYLAVKDAAGAEAKRDAIARLVGNWLDAFSRSGPKAPY